MKIAMFTNTYLPHVGGVARSVSTLEEGCRRHGHEVVVIAPEADDAIEDPRVLRVPAIQHFNGTDFSVRLPVPNLIREFVQHFQPDLIHSHHPFLLGDAALRESWKNHVPIVFTHHTLYERYTHYVSLDFPALRRVAIQLATEYANLCDAVIAPSESIAKLLEERGVSKPVVPIPTGIDISFFTNGDGARFRRMLGIPLEAHVIGHCGRLAREKNLLFLADAVGRSLGRCPDAVFLIVGEGDAAGEMYSALRDMGVENQVHMAGKRMGQDLADAYAAMDCFAFASQSETQGMVLAEAMAAGTPVVALDGPGVRDILTDKVNGLLLSADAMSIEFAEALDRLISDRGLAACLAERARETAACYQDDLCISRMLECYEDLVAGHTRMAKTDFITWDRFISGMEIEWDLISAKMAAAVAAVIETPATEATLD